jgi:hypothetical protein
MCGPLNFTIAAPLLYCLGAYDDLILNSDLINGEPTSYVGA